MDKKITKKQLIELFDNCEGFVLHDDCGEPGPLKNEFELLGSFDGYNVFRRK